MFKSVANGVHIKNDDYFGPVSYSINELGSAKEAKAKKPRYKLALVKSQKLQGRRDLRPTITMIN